MVKQVNDVEYIFKSWQALMDKHKAKPSPKRLQKIRMMLKYFTVNEVISAIEGCKKSGFHMGDNPQKVKYNDIELICRSVEKVEFFIDINSVNEQRDSELEAWVNAGQ